MPAADLNLLTALDALLTEGGVTAAARRLRLSPSAMSRTLGRLRSATGDPLLVPAGRALVPTPYGEGLRERVRAAAEEAQAILSPAAAAVVPATLDRTLTIRANEAFVAFFAASLVAAIVEAAPGVRVRFAPKFDQDARPLREGAIDLDVGADSVSGPEVRSRLILRDRYVGAARCGHGLFDAPITPDSYAACRHVVSSRSGRRHGPVDDALQALGLERAVAVTVPSFPDALSICRRSDLVALVPHSCFASADLLTEGLLPFDLPVATPPLAISVMWHPRLDADPAHRWLREKVIATCHGMAAALSK